MAKAKTKAKTKPKAKAKAKAKPIAKTKAAKSTAAIPAFPFLGQGDASYYEWFEMWIWFAEPVPKAKRKAVLADAPKLCKMDAQWPDDSLLWASTGDQFIQMHLIDAYGARDAAGARADLDDEDYEYGPVAENGETERFNEDIERWLTALHGRTPILFAARGQDFEAGGTALGKWHEASVGQFTKDVVPALEAYAKKTKKKWKGDDLRRAPIAIAIEYAGEKKVSKTVRELGRES